jgi:phenylpropionate dioxygenase-like ring-hydroxylating dioxygenase large terminal subunit
VLVGLHRREFAVNWKTMLEAFIETHHIATLHPQVAKALLYQEASVAHFRRHSMTVVPAARASRWDERRTQSWRAWLEDPAYLEYHYTIFPNVSVHVFLWGLTFLFRCLPHARDPERMTMDVWIWKRIAEGETPPEPLSMPNAMQMILDQDYGNVELVQRGMRSRAFDHPRLSAFESRIGHLHAVLDGYLDGRGA